MEKIKIIFLDIDGVLNCQRYYKSWFKKHKKQVPRDKYGQLFDPTAEELLNRLIRETGAKIVVSSTWRHAGLKAMRDMWKLRKMEGEVIGITPDFRGDLRVNAESSRYGSNMNQLIRLKSDRGVTIPRGSEIEWYYRIKHNFAHWQWDGEYVRKQKEKCTLSTYVILDDDSDMLYEQRKNFVHCKNSMGFGEKQYLKALKILTREED